MPKFGQMKKLHELVKEAEHRKGEKSEKRFDEAAYLLIDEGKIVTTWPANFNEDHDKKFDRVIETIDGLRFEFQIKSSQRGVDDFKNEHPELSHIKLVVVDENDSKERIAQKIVRELGR